jgi:hypothetical protein
MKDEGMAELVSVLLAMGALLVVAVVAVVIFFRTWNKERKKGGRKFFE